MLRRLLLPALLLLLACGVARAQGGGFTIEPRPPFIQGIPFSATVRAADAAFTGAVTVEVLDEAGAPIGEAREVVFGPDAGGVATLEGVVIPPRTEAVGDATHRAKDSYYRPRTVSLRVQGATTEVRRVLPDWAAVAPPLIAIVLAILFRQVLVALMLGVVAGVLIMKGLHPGHAFTAVVDEYIVPAVADEGHASIIVFSLLLGAMVGVISKSGGTTGIVHALTHRTTTRRAGQVSSAGIGSAIFFDDYANCLIVGNTMRPITDRLRISREKLAYIVDSTAAPVTSLVPLSTWVGAQISYVQDGLKNAGQDESQAYRLIIQAIPYMFYPIFALFLVYYVAWLGRDAFTMLSAERRAAREGKLLRDGAKPLAAGEEDDAIRAKDGKPHRAINAVLPVLTVVGVTIFALVHTGWSGWAGATLEQGIGVAAREVLSNADSYSALLWASLAGLTVAIGLAWVQRILSLDEAVTAGVAGMKAMLLAMAILTLAWSLAAVADNLHTIDYLQHVATSAGIEGGWFPLLVFGLAAATAFSTGTAWGTMAILVPLMVPMSHAMAGSPTELADPIILGSIAACLGGAVFGDHCSPISDTTVLSSMASSCDHIDHVRTQLPYALMAAIFAGGAGYLPIAYGAPGWMSLPIGLLALFLAVRFLFRPVVRGRGAETPDAGPPGEETATAG